MPRSRTSSTDSFHSFTSDTPPPQPTTTQNNGTSSTTSHATDPSTPTTSQLPPPITNEITRLPPSEEGSLLSQSNTLKSTGNQQFTSSDYSSAIQTYDKALAGLPNYLDYEIAVLNANVAACHLKLEEWKEAVSSATRALDGLERLDPLPKSKSKATSRPKPENGSGQGPAGRRGSGRESGREEEPDPVEEIDDETEAAIQRLQDSGHTHTETQRLRIKALLRRAKARTELGTWSELQAADEDYSTLLSMRELSGIDRKSAEREIRALKPRLEEVKSREMKEMMGKLKGLGDGLLKPFGMSTDMFKFVKDEKSGGYSMSFDQGGGGKK